MVILRGCAVVIDFVFFFESPFNIKISWFLPPLAIDPHWNASLSIIYHLINFLFEEY